MGYTEEVHRAPHETSLGVPMAGTGTTRDVKVQVAEGRLKTGRCDPTGAAALSPFPTAGPPRPASAGGD